MPPVKTSWIVVFPLALLLSVQGSPAQAGSVPTRQDSVERASATVAQNLSDLAAERAEAVRRSALERQKSNALASRSLFLTPTGSLLGRGSLDWLAGQSDPAVTGILPVAGREGLLVSYAIPLNDPRAFLRGRSWTYDNAVAAAAFLAQGQISRAKSVLAALNRLVAPDGGIGFSYQVDSSYYDPRVRTGTLAWVGYAFAFYQRQTGDAAYQATSERIASYLKGLQMASGSLKGGPDVSWVSTEHNIDAYFFFRELFRVTGNGSYLTTANQIKNSLLANHWVGGSSPHFLQGIGDPAPALDANSWGAIFLWAIGRGTQANQALKYVESTFKTTQKVSGTSTKITGYAPDAARKTVWLEGTLGVAMAYERQGAARKADSILNSVAALQSAWEKQGRWQGALPYAMPRYKNADGDTFAEWESVSSTGWENLVLALRAGSSRFWDRD